MKAEDVKRTVEKAIEKAKIKTKQKPKLLLDNGPCYVSNELKYYIRGKPISLQSQGKIESLLSFRRTYFSTRKVSRKLQQ